MLTTASAEISRHQFLAAGGLTVAAACLVPTGLCAQKDDLVEHALNEAATAKVTVQTRRNAHELGLGQIKTRLTCCRITNRRWARLPRR